jgi:16S rRNA U516 pseudouridylate synthase RsuA-like enzyme
MDDDVFNMQIRKFLKNVGVTSQREIELAVRKALADGRIKGDGQLNAKVTLTIDEVGLSQVIEGDINLV